MKDIILQKLKDVEMKENISILYAVESGSRAWGFESYDSDYDVRFVYVRKMTDYLSLFPLKDTINVQCDELLDINGWDLSKALKLLYKSNPTLYEWKNSPIVYIKTKQWESLDHVFQTYFQTSTALHHYYHMAHQAYHMHPFTSKKCLYTLRCLLACLWIIDNQTPPPILFQTLVDEKLDDCYHDEIKKLVHFKKHSSEKTIYELSTYLHDYIEEQLINISHHLQPIPNKPSIELLNNEFYRILKETTQK